MGFRYIIHAFNYPFRGYEIVKHTRWLVVAVAYIIYYSLKYDGVSFEGRK